MIDPLFYWEGRSLLMDTIVHHKRYVTRPDGARVSCPFDVRRWVMPPEDELMGSAWEQLGRHHKKRFESLHPSHWLDLKAKAIWDFVVEQIPFLQDPDGKDYWQFPPETLLLRSGDCEDKAFLIASLLLAAGASPDRVRVVLGMLISPQRREGHAWAMYRNTHGLWCILEPNIPHLPIRVSHDVEAKIEIAPRRAPLDNVVFMSADRLATDDARERYIPLVCFHHASVWTVEQVTPGKVREAEALEPDWSTNPTFDQILEWAGSQLSGREG